VGKPSDHPGFKKIKRKWDQRLAESGFKDLEHPSGKLKQRASNAYRGASPEQREAKLDFFMKVAQHTSETRFQIRGEKFIMESFAEGVPQVEIERRLAARGIRKHRITILKIIKKWLLLWNLK